MRVLFFLQDFSFFFSPIKLKIIIDEIQPSAIQLHYMLKREVMVSHGFEQTYKYCFPEDLSVAVGE